MMCILPAEREPLRPHFGLRRRRLQPKRRVNSTLCEMRCEQQTIVVAMPVTYYSLVTEGLK